ncbi:hypothetical protein GCM10010964_44430 [Caldovatus sediminis]|uniref:Uncharacterized protein n=1 Tax=Caldovatus sediminis TaxID=2041189 RepID=A0A8J2ZG52_9PROT|nr:hypothetical protein [Caldovatus sediminis]GGG52389.1 hypothetical protein GCM10010964_44430 [Caldovatus sediminis]
MSRKQTALFTAAALVGGFVAAQGVLAQDTRTAPPAGTAQQAQPGAPQPGQGMMGGGMMGMMNMMGQMDPAQMNRMMENCNRMMEARSRGGPGTGPSTPAPNQQGG